jgi:hypothetical protein
MFPIDQSRRAVRPAGTTRGGSAPAATAALRVPIASGAADRALTPRPRPADGLARVLQRTVAGRIAAIEPAALTRPTLQRELTPVKVQALGSRIRSIREWALRVDTPEDGQ